MYHVKLVKSGLELDLFWVGWRDNGLGFYAKNGAGNRLLISLDSPYPDNDDTGEAFRYPPLRVVEILPVRLRPPPCFATREDVIRSGNKEALYCEVKDAATLRTALDDYREAASAARDAELNEARTTPDQTIAHLSRRPLRWLRNQPTTEAVAACRQEVTRDIEAKFQRKWNATIADLMHGATPDLERLRNACLEARWAREHGHDLRALEEALSRFLLQCQKAAGGGYQSVTCQERTPFDHFEMRCNDGNRYFVTGFTVRDHFTPGEAREIGLLEQLATPIVTAKASAVSETTPALRSNTISKTGQRHWTVTFNGFPPFQVGDCAAGDRLKWLLEHPNERFDPLRLASLLGGAVLMKENERIELRLEDATARKTSKAVTEKEYRSAKTALEGAIMEAEEAGRFEEKQDLVQKLHDLETRWENTNSDDLRREYKRLHAALDRLKSSARKAGTAGGRAFAQHLDVHLRWNGYRVEYSPDDGRQWNY